MSIPFLGDAASDAQERRKEEEWLATYYLSAFFILLVFTLALHPLTKSL